MYGLRPPSHALSKTGAMVNSVMKSARLIRMMFAGVEGRPSPDRRNESAMMNRVKHVTITSMPGATDNTVTARISCTIRAEVTLFAS